MSIQTRDDMGDAVRTLLASALAVQEGRVEDAKHLRETSPLDDEEWFWAASITVRDLGRLLAMGQREQPEVVMSKLALDTALQHANRKLNREEEE